jgi:propionate CoA-transferase
VVRIASAEQAAGMIKPGDTVTVSGLLGNLVPERILEALEQRYLATGEPRDLTQIHPWFYGVPDGSGLNRWGHEGLCRRMIGSTYIPPYLSKTSELNQLILRNAVEAYCLPANGIFQMLRAVGAKRSGFLTQIGLDTFADPRRGGGKLNESAKDDLVELVTAGGEEHLFYRSIPIDVALIRASTADTEGNLSCEDEGLTQGILVQATAARNSGGLVIAQVKRLVEPGTIHPLMVEVPGVLVDVVVVHEEGLQWEYGGNQGNAPATTGAHRMPLPEITYWPHSADKVIARRAMMEIGKGELVNVGGGIPAAVMPTVAIEEQMADKARWSVEHGVFGGVCMGATHWNPTAILSPTWLLDFYNGGGLDLSFLGLGQVDRFGHVNVGKVADQFPGVGGFTDIAAATRRVRFCGTMTVGGLEIDATEGRLRVLREGDHRKFLQDVEMVCFSGRRALETGQDIEYITERAVFRLTADGLVLTEIAPGVDCKSQVLELADFPIAVAPDTGTSRRLAVAG